MTTSNSTLLNIKGNGNAILVIGSIFLWVLFASPYPSDPSEQVGFDIIFKGKKVGKVEATKTPKSGGMHYNIQSQVKISIIKTFQIDFSLKNQYWNSGLEEARIKNTVNNNIRDYSTLDWQGDHYHVTKQNESFKLNKKQARFSTACLYFEEPQERSTVFSENYLDYIPIEKIEQNQYKLKLPSGNSNLYYYNEQKELEKAIIRDAILQFSFERKEQ